VHAGVCFSVIGTFVALSQVCLECVTCTHKSADELSFTVLPGASPSLPLYTCLGSRHRHRVLKQIDFTFIRILADLSVNFYTTGWYVFLLHLRNTAREPRLSLNLQIPQVFARKDCRQTAIRSMERPRQIRCRRRSEGDARHPVLRFSNL
jgi:hypothetical protein